MEVTVEQLLERMARRTFSVMEDSEVDGLILQRQLCLRPQPYKDIRQLLEKAEREKEERNLKKSQLESEKEELRTRLMHLRLAKDNADGSLHFAVELQKTQQLKKQEQIDELAAAGIQDPANFDASESRSNVLRAAEELKKLERDIEVQPCLTKLTEKAEWD